MCQFFSAISKADRVLFFRIEDVCKLMAEGNPKNYEWNSHTSISHFHGIAAEDEQNWNFWEYNIDKKELILDRGKDENRNKIKNIIEDYLFETIKDTGYVRNLYNKNSGHWNSGNRNSGHWNSGNRNSGDSNSGDSNSGNSNSGHWNSGNRNSGHWNSGNRNSGGSNSGDSNSGDRNSGHWNSGDSNSGDSNSGNRNSGNRNSGHWNSGNGVINNLCNKRIFILFNKVCTQKNIEYCNNVLRPIWNNFYLTNWISESKMTDDEKQKYSYYKITGGYLRRYEYKEAFKTAWDKVKSKELIKKIKKIRHFNSKIWFEITGIKI